MGSREVVEDAWKGFAHTYTERTAYSLDMDRANGTSGEHYTLL